MTFILGFIIGAVTEFIALLIITHEVWKKREKEILKRYAKKWKEVK